MWEWVYAWPSRCLLLMGIGLRYSSKIYFIFMIWYPSFIELSSPFGHGLNLLLPHYQGPQVNFDPSWLLFEILVDFQADCQSTNTDGILVVVEYWYRSYWIIQSTDLFKSLIYLGTKQVNCWIQNCFLSRHNISWGTNLATVVSMFYIVWMFVLVVLSNN